MHRAGGRAESCSAPGSCRGARAGAGGGRRGNRGRRPEPPSTQTTERPLTATSTPRRGWAVGDNTRKERPPRPIHSREAFILQGVTGWPGAVLWSGPQSSVSTSPRSQCPLGYASLLPHRFFLPTLPHRKPHRGTTTDCTQTRPSCLAGGATPLSPAGGSARRRATCQVHATSTSPGRASTEGVSRPALNGAHTPLESVGDGLLCKIICNSAGSKIWTTFKGKSEQHYNVYF